MSTQEIPWQERHKVGDLPEGKSGNVTIERFTVSKRDAEMDSLRSAISCGGRGSGRFTPAGTYTMIREGGTLWMSDTPDEIRDHLGFIGKATGRVLIHGLGIGVVARACLLKPEVTAVTVVELSADVIKLVRPWLHRQAYAADTSLEVIEGDALTYKHAKGRRWECAWHDIWPDICPDNLETMSTLHRRFARRVDFQDSWVRDLLKARKRQEQRSCW